MFQIKITGVTYEFDSAQYQKELHLTIEREVKLAAAEFAKVALSKIPIRTGFVAGAFGTLTDLLPTNTVRLNPVVAFTRKVLKFFGIGKNNKKPKTPNYRQGEYYYPGGGTRILKTPTSGRQFATKAADIFKWEGGVFSFNYEVDISYFRINDSIAGHAPTAPWGAFIAAQEAFEKYMNEKGINNFAKIESFIKEKPIK